MSGSFAELPEGDATGRIAEIYAEVRHFYGVPYVSSLQRHLATLPGVLEWAWQTLRPAFASGVLPETAWRLARQVDLAPLPKLSRETMHLLGADDAATIRIRDICRSFETVAPLNMAMGGCIRALLHGASTGGMGFSRTDWQPPAPLPEPPEMLRPDAVDGDTRTVLMRLATDMDGVPFVPGLYRQLAHWPAYLAHAAAEITPLFGDPDVTAACQSLRERIADAVPGLLAGLPAAPPVPAEASVDHILAAIETYQQTSPQMICFGRLLREALPA